MVQSPEQQCNRPEQQAVNSSPYQSVAAEGYSANAPTSFQPSDSNAGNYLPTVEITTGSGQSKDTITLNFSSLPPGSDVNINIAPGANGQDTISISDSTPPNISDTSGGAGNGSKASTAGSDSGNGSTTSTAGSDSGKGSTSSSASSDSGDSSKGGTSASSKGGISAPTGGGTGTTGSSAPGAGTANPTLAAMEKADPTLANTLGAASGQLTKAGISSLDNYLASNNPSANSNLDATLMSNSLTKAGLSSTDSKALQNVIEQDMPVAQVLNYAQTNDSTLYKTVTDASSQLSTAGYSQLENYLVNNYTTNNNLDSTLMSGALSQAGLSSSDQAAMKNVLQSDMPTALDADPFVASLQTTDPTLAKTLTDASNALSASGYEKDLEPYVESNYDGGTSGDAALMSSALTGAGLNSADESALETVLKSDLPAAVTEKSSTAGSGSGSSSSTSGSGSSSSTSGSGSSDSTSGSGSSSTPIDSGNTIYGVTSANNAKLAAENPDVVNGNLNGPDALHMTGDTLMLSQNQAGDGFSQKYGFFEADLKAPDSASGWPGWWLESTAHAADPSKYPSAEIDIMEMQTGTPNGTNQYFTTLHSSSTVDGTTPGTTDQQTFDTITPGGNLSDGFNWYGVLNTPDSKDLDFYFNGKQVAQIPKYDDTDFSPEELVLDESSGGWANPSQSTNNGVAEAKAIVALSNPSWVNSTNDPGGTLGTTLTDVTPQMAPAVTNGMEATFVSNFTQGQDSVSEQGVTDGTIWSDGDLQFPATSWGAQGMSEQPA